MESVISESLARQEDDMTISRAKAGFAMIGVSIVFFLIADSIENLETQLGVAAAAFVENCLFIAALALIAVGTTWPVLVRLAQCARNGSHSRQPSASSAAITLTLRRGRIAGNGFVARKHFHLI